MMNFELSAMYSVCFVFITMMTAGLLGLNGAFDDIEDWFIRKSDRTQARLTILGILVYGLAVVFAGWVVPVLMITLIVAGLSYVVGMVLLGTYKLFKTALFGSTE